MDNMLLFNHKEVLHMFKFEAYISKSAVKHLLLDSDLAREYPPALLENGICNLVCDKATIDEGVSLLVDLLDRNCKSDVERENLACKVYNTVVKVNTTIMKLA